MSHMSSLLSQEAFRSQEAFHEMATGQIDPRRWYIVIVRLADSRSSSEKENVLVAERLNLSVSVLNCSTLEH